MIDLIRPTVRATRWGGLLVLAAPSAYLIWHLHNQPFLSASTLGWGLRAAAMMIAAGLAFTLDDPTEDIVGYAPVSLVMRRALRICLALPPALAFWLALRTYSVDGLAPPDRMPVGDLAVEFMTFAFVAYAGAAAGSRVLSDRLGGIAGAGAVLMVGAALALFPWGSGILRRTPGTPEASTVTMWWWGLLALAAYAWWRLSLPPGMPLWRRAKRG